jgi:hypothetical protein
MALEDADALALMAAEPARNMDPAERAYEVRESLDDLPRQVKAIDDLARTRADALLADHSRVREAAAARGFRTTVEACLPVDIIGAFVLLPA